MYRHVDYSPGAPASFRHTGCNGVWWLWGILFLLRDLVLLSAEAALPVMISLCVSVSFHLSGLSGISATLGVFLGLFLFISLFPSLCILAFLFFLESLILRMYLSLSLWVLSFCPLTKLSSPSTSCSYISPRPSPLKHPGTPFKQCSDIKSNCPSEAGLGENPLRPYLLYDCLISDQAQELPQRASGRQITAEEKHLVLGIRWLGCSKHLGGSDPACPTLMHAVSALR